MPIPLPPTTATLAARTQRTREHILYGTPQSGRTRTTDARPMHDYLDPLRCTDPVPRDPTRAGWGLSLHPFHLDRPVPAPPVQGPRHPFAPSGHLL